MATRASIEFDFQKAMNEANRIDAIANNLSNVSQRRFGGTLQNISANWKGENAGIYLNKGGRLQERMNGTAAELHSIASDIRRIARRIYLAEKAALAIAQQRNY